MNDPRNTWNEPAAAPAKASSTSRPSKSPRWAMLNAFVDHGMRHLGRAALAVWLVLYRETNRQGLSRITIEQIAEKAGLSVSSVKNGVGELRAFKMVVQASRGSRNKGPSIYRLLPVSTVSPLAIEQPPSTVSPLAIEVGKRAFSTASPLPTATASPLPTPQKEQEHRPPLGASAVHENEEEKPALRITV